MTEFSGFPSEGLAFLKELAQNNNRDFFSAQRAIYENRLSEPAKAFVLALGEELKQRFSAQIHAEPKVGKSLFRINRDLRFSKDKTPYNPWIDFVFWEGGENARTCPGFILRIAAGHIVVGTGVFTLPPEHLDRFQKAVIDEKQGSLLTAIIKSLKTQNESIEISQPSRIRVPSAFSSDHPRADLLRMERLHASIQEQIPDAIHGREFVAWCAERYRDFLPLHQWLVRNLTGDSQM